ncbi:nucleotide sugar dehydrogenase [Deinococcus radiopugnans]|uniref:UDP-N-acetyl-D-glucosamine dehydrogenase n=1 Tax=Deinococcus radiopugnans ATCC 19172 TaxID=585398 RepID=A0ABR6NWC8_9DEIO|nr:nucleotide sugar dehydrogenase [Deinococcus radiopugnans]MBB6017754.1 UDP-N-acetyl-D-glucosamine dehydrogenase [Deinococcus radiopugnans ATCC 19172]
MIKIDPVSAAVEKIVAHTAKVGVVGLGYVGLPFLVEKAKVGFEVVGIDRSAERAGMVARGENYIGDVRDEDLKAVVEQGLVTTTTDFDVVPELDVIVICVPTPLDRNLTPDLSYIRSVTQEIAQRLRPGQLISLESTTYPGTTEEVMKPILEAGGLKAGVDFFLAHSPERVDPGNARYTTKNTNKVVGGNDPASLEVALAFYRQTIEHVVAVSSAKAAEMVKVYENTFRAVNIALANEIALLCDRMGISVWEVLDAAFTKPFGIMPFYPGPGVGGHCIPLDPHYLEWKAREYNFQTHFIALAGETNRKMPEFVVDKAARVLNGARKSLNGSKVLLLGMAYKSDLDDYRESPALEVYRLLKESGAEVSFHDSWTPEVNEHGIQATGIDLTDQVLQDADLVIITTKHSDVDYANVIEQSQAILDTRYATRGMTSDKVTLL